MSIQSIYTQNQITTAGSIFSEQIQSKVSSLYQSAVAGFEAGLDFVMPKNPVTSSREIRLVPAFVEHWMGIILYPMHILQSGGAIREDNPRYSHYVKMVKEVGSELAAKGPRKDLNCEFTVVNSKEENAWCLPGGKIAINLGLIKKMEQDETDYGLGFKPTLKEKIGAVLSHEWVHAGARHTSRALEFRFFLWGMVKSMQYALSYFIRTQYEEDLKGAKKTPQQVEETIKKRDAAIASSISIFDSFSQWILSGIHLCKSRKHELESDKYGMHLLAEVGKTANPCAFNPQSPQAAIWLQHYFKTHHDHSTGYDWIDTIVNVFSTHPSPTERLDANKKTWEEMRK